MGFSPLMRGLGERISAMESGKEEQKRGLQAIGIFGATLGFYAGIIIIVQLVILNWFPGTPLPASQTNVLTNVLLDILVAVIGVYFTFAWEKVKRTYIPFIVSGITMMFSYWILFYLVSLGVFG